MNDHEGAFLAESVAACQAKADTPAFRVILEDLLKGIDHLVASRGMASCPGANGDTGLMGVSSLDDLFP
jgi:hypothetical protein